MTMLHINSNILFLADLPQFSPFCIHRTFFFGWKNRAFLLCKLMQLLLCALQCAKIFFSVRCYFD